MNGEILAGMILVLVVLIVMTALVFVSRARVERIHRGGSSSTRPRSGTPRNG